jgi:hypothetical protein
MCIPLWDARTRCSTAVMRNPRARCLTEPGFSGYVNDMSEPSIHSTN